MKPRVKLPGIWEDVAQYWVNIVIPVNCKIDQPTAKTGVPGIGSGSERSVETMASLNKVMIIGNVGSEPEMRFTPSGNPVTSFRVATTRVYTTADGERNEETKWFGVVAWGRLAEQCNQFLTKGRRVYAEGRLHTNTWQSQKSFQEGM